jgi:hypothetical protein
MPSLDPKAGNRYLTISGAPVQVLEVREGIMLLQGLASDNRLCVPTTYLLQPFDQEKAAWEMRPALYSARSKKAKGLTAPNKPLAPIIDAMLLKGGMTMRGILRQLRRKASAACRGKDLKANVRARIYWLKKRGCRVAVKGDVQL